MFHQAEEKRQVVDRRPFFVQRQDVTPSRGLQQEVRILDAFRDSLVGAQLAKVIARQKCFQLLNGDIGIDRHG
jgi:hypothetical protein